MALLWSMTWNGNDSRLLLPSRLPHYCIWFSSSATQQEVVKHVLFCARLSTHVQVITKSDFEIVQESCFGEEIGTIKSNFYDATKVKETE